jgi:pectate disaccharide-lyase
MSAHGFRHSPFVGAWICPGCYAVWLALPLLGETSASVVPAPSAVVLPTDAAVIRVSDFQQLNEAVRTLAGVPTGGTILLKGGRYVGQQPLLLSRIDGRGRINIWAETGQTVVLDFSPLRDLASTDAKGHGITLSGDGYHLKGLTVEKAGSFGILISGSRNIVENCVTRYNGNTGLQIGLPGVVANPGPLPSNNLVRNCDSYRNFDAYAIRSESGKPAPGNDADGFGCRSNPGPDNRFEGCRAWENADDGWDFYRSSMPTEVADCWSWHEGDPKVFTGVYDRENGNPKDPNLIDLNKPHPVAKGTTIAQQMGNWAGNGNGFKLGGQQNKGRPTLTNCIAFDHSYGKGGQKGFDENNNRGKIVITGCTAFGNNQNYSLPYAATTVGLLVFADNVGFDGRLPDVLGAFGDKVIVPSAQEQKRIMTEMTKAARAPRKSDGSLPDLVIRQ